VVSSSYIKALTRSSQEKLIQAKAEVDVARLDVEDRDREWQTLVAHRQAVQRETRKLNSAAMVEDRKDRL
jgi:cell division protein FtsB